MPCKGKPFKRFSAIAAWMERPRPSAMMMKRKGERGSPCLIPLEGEKVLEGIPLTKMEKKAEEVKFMIHVTQLWSKLKAKSMARI